MRTKTCQSFPVPLDIDGLHWCAGIILSENRQFRKVLKVNHKIDYNVGKVTLQEKGVQGEMSLIYICHLVGEGCLYWVHHCTSWPCRLSPEEVMARWAQVCSHHGQDSAEILSFSSDNKWRTLQGNPEHGKDAGQKGQNLEAERGKAWICLDWMVRFRGPCPVELILPQEYSIAKQSHTHRK